MKGFFINLASSVERNDRMKREIERLPYPVERFDAIDGAKEFPNSKEPAYKGNSASHIAVWKMAMNIETVVHVLEDDCVFATAYGDWYNDLVLPQEWDIFLTDIFISPYSGVYEIFEKELIAYEATGKFSMIDLSQLGFGGTTSYFINPSSVEKLLALFEDEALWEIPIDHLLSRYVVEGKIKTYCAVPFVTSFDTTALHSTIRTTLPAIEQQLYPLRRGFFVDTINKAESRQALMEATALRIQNQTGVHQVKEMLFPSPVLIRHFELTKILNTALYNEVWLLCHEGNDGYRSTYGGLRSYSNFFDNPSYAMQELKMMIENTLSEYCNSFLAMMIKLEPNSSFDFIITPWAYLLSPGDFMKPHVHPDGFISGCYYVRVPETKHADEGAIVFEAPDNGRSLSRIPTTANNTSILRPKEGNMVLFPSYLPHYGVPFSEGKRAVIAFDIILNKK